MDLIRCFFCIEPDPMVRENIREWISHKRKDVPQLKWVSWSDLHITLKFCGEILSERQQELSLQIGIALREAGQKPFRMSLAGIGMFPNLRNPRVIWIGLEEGRDEIMRLQGIIEDECGKIGGIVRETRPFHPHLTLARIKKDRTLPMPFIRSINEEESSFGTCDVNSLIFMKSRLTPQGPVYSPMNTFEFKN